MGRVKKNINPDGHTPSSEPFRTKKNNVDNSLRPLTTGNINNKRPSGFV
jgi:hypothetical protein